MYELDVLAKFRDVPPPSDETMREVAVLFAAETDLMRTPAKRFGARHLAIAGGSVAAAAAVFGVVSLVGSITAPAQPQASGNARDVILAAYNANADSIMYIATTHQTGNQQPFTTEDWYSSPDAKPGQTFTHRGIMRMQPGEKDGLETFVVPSVGPLPANCHVLGLPDNRVGQELAVDGVGLTVNYDSKTFYRDTNGCMLWGEELPQQLRDQIASGQWQRVPGETTVDGQRAIEYTKVSVGDKSKGVGDIHTSLWINADTNLPIKMEEKDIAVDGKTVTFHETDNYSFLPNTAENRVNLVAPIPSGFKQISSPWDALGPRH
ncbi:MAG TPA: hypothetical protein VGN81_24110 [Pseudonocardiaceae bacterium]|jgi:hypothetical protein